MKEPNHKESCGGLYIVEIKWLEQKINDLWTYGS